MLTRRLTQMTAARGPVVGVVSSSYDRYADAPFYRRQWFFWTMWVFFAPVAIALLVTGDVYYVKNGKVRAFGKANRIVAGFFALIWLAGIVNALITRDISGRFQQEAVMKSESQREPEVQAWRQPPKDSMLTHEADAQAVDVYRKAAEQGDADAQSNLGWAYANGRGVSPDYTQAAQWYRKAAELGNAF